MKAPEYHWIVGDVETAPREDAKRFLEPVKPAANLKDPAKIAEDIAKREAKQLEQIGLDWNVNRIVSLGYQTEIMAQPKVILCQTAEQEMAALREFWEKRSAAGTPHRTFVGFCNGTFDAPVMVQRSRLLGIGEPTLRLHRYDNEDVRDLYRALTFDIPQRTSVIAETLETFCRLFGITVQDDIDGSMIAELVAEGRWDEVAAHNYACVKRTVALGKVLGVLHQPCAEPAEVL